MRVGAGLLLFVVVSALPLLAVASEPFPETECAQLAARFGSTPRALSISALDQLRSCINQQQQAMRAAADARQEAQSLSGASYSPHLSPGFLP